MSFESLSARILTRRRALALGAASAGAVILPSRVFAQGAPQPGGRTRVDVTQGQFKPIPIAVPDFIGSEQAGVNVTKIVTDNLRRSGLFAPIDPASYIEKITNSDATPRFPDWKAINADALAVGRLSKQGDGRSRAEFRLWDVNQGKQLAGEIVIAPPGSPRRIAHIISDVIYERLTGEKGYFDTRIVFIDETGAKDRRQKRLAIMDQDGANVKYLTRGGDLVLTPRFSPSGPEITYMAYGQSDPRVILMNIDTGQREVVGDFKGMTFAPRFSPDGQRIVMSLQQGGNSSIFSMDLRSKATMRLTDSTAIDTGPSFSPDGARICFESDRGGKPQIYVMSASGGAAQRISFQEGSYSTPVWSPRGDYIAFTKQSKGQFAIGVMKPDGSGERVLTEGYHNEGPTWAPNGRVLMFFRDQGGGPSLYTVDISGRYENKVQTPAYASDPAWSPLLR